MALPLFRGMVFGLFLAVALHVGAAVVWTNFHVVLPGQVYRCSQPSATQLERFIRQHGIRTVVNLRGCCVNLDWYRAEAEVCGRLDVSLEDLTFSASRLPSRHTVTQLIEVLERCEYPILFHCHQGADRTGLAAVLAKLLLTESSLPAALQELHLSRGHLAAGKTKAIDDFFALYAHWLAERGLPHRPRRFREWLTQHYHPAGACCSWKLLHPEARSAGGVTYLQLPQGQKLLEVSCQNNSRQTWRFHPGSNAGIHASLLLLDSNQRIIHADRLGQFAAQICPGQSVTLQVPLPALQPGRYTLQFDLVDEQKAYFLQLGEQPLIVELDVRD